MTYAGALGLYASGALVLDGSVLKGLLMLVLGTPLLVWVATLLFGFIAAGIDAAFAKGAKNVFRE